MSSREILRTKPNMASSSFLALPSEIRRKIYHYCFADSPISFTIFEVDRRLFSWFRKDPLYRWVLTSRPPDHLLDTCRQIRHEALPELQSRLRVSCDITERAVSANMTVMPLRNVLGNNIRSLHLIVYSQYTFWPRNEMPLLRHVLVESRYRPLIILHRSKDGFLDRSAAALIEAVKSWHLDLLDEPEIPDSPGSWGMLKAMLHPDRHFILEWRGFVVVHCQDNLIGEISTDEVELCFDWDTKNILEGEEAIGRIAERNPYH